MVDHESINVGLLLAGAATSFVGGLVVGTWAVSAKMHMLSDHEKRLSRLEHCIEQKLDRLHERIDDLMVGAGMDPTRVRRDYRHDSHDGETKKKGYYE